MAKRAFQDITNLNPQNLKNIKLTIHKSSHRTQLLRWIYEVCMDFKYSSFTYVTAAMVIDEYTEKITFAISEYQLIGISCVFIAAKIEERYRMTVSEYAHVTDKSCTESEILKKELEILEAINYKMPPKLPQAYFDVGYFRSRFKKYKMAESQEIVYCIISAMMENKNAAKNSFHFYLEAVREMESIVATGRVPAEIEFYINKNQKIRSLLKL